MYACSFRRHAGLLASCDATAGGVLALFSPRRGGKGDGSAGGPRLGCIVYGQTTEKSEGDAKRGESKTIVAGGSDSSVPPYSVRVLHLLWRQEPGKGG